MNDSNKTLVWALSEPFTRHVVRLAMQNIRERGERPNRESVQDELARSLEIAREVGGQMVCNRAEVPPDWVRPWVVADYRAGRLGEKPMLDRGSLAG
jgi:hypothetical protein